MSSFNRRQFLKFLGVASAMSAATLALRVNAATTAPRVVVIGGGFGGATVAKYLKHWGDNVDVTIVDPNAQHTSCVMSNLVLTGDRPMDFITLSYDGLRNRGVHVVQDRAVGIDPVTQHVALASGATLPYDRVVLSPGIDFMPIEGWDPNQVPHAWQAGPQTTLLKNQLAAMPAGGTFVMTVPKPPYRCPPGPYERACVVADYLKRNKPGSKIIVLDANPNILVETRNFTAAFESYQGVLEYQPNVSVNSVDSSTRTLYTSAGNIQGSVVNLVGSQRAGEIVRAAGLADAAGRWAPVSPLTYESAIIPNIHIVGDAQGTTQPKSGHQTSSEAKVCADAILRSFAGLAPNPAPVTGTACYSPVSSNKAIFIAITYQYDPKTGNMVASSTGEAKEASGDIYEDMFKWADGFFADSFT